MNKRSYPRVNQMILAILCFSLLLAMIPLADINLDGMDESSLAGMDFNIAGIFNLSMILLFGRFPFRNNPISHPFLPYLILPPPISKTF